MAKEVKILNFTLSNSAHLMTDFGTWKIYDYPEAEQQVARYLAAGYRIINISAANANNVFVILER